MAPSSRAGVDVDAQLPGLAVRRRPRRRVRRWRPCAAWSQSAAHVGIARSGPGRRAARGARAVVRFGVGPAFDCRFRRVSQAGRLAGAREARSAFLLTAVERRSRSVHASLRAASRRAAVGTDGAARSPRPRWERAAARERRLSSEPAPTIESGSTASWRYIHEHYAQELTLQELADVAALSVSGLHRMFRKHARTNVSEYITRIRIGDACARLASTEQPIAHIADVVGYGTFANFNRQFKLLTSMTPREYRAHFRRASG